MANIITVQAKDLQRLQGQLTKAQKQTVRIIEKELENLGQISVQALQERAPRDESRFAEGIGYQIGKRGTADMELRIQWTPKNRPKDLFDWIVFGTGIYGPRKKPIVPKRAKFLRFTPSGGSRPIFRRSVRGMKPRNFVKEAWRDIADYRRIMARRVGGLVVDAIEGKRGGGDVI